VNDFSAVEQADPDRRGWRKRLIWLLRLIVVVTIALLLGRLILIHNLSTAFSRSGRYPAAYVVNKSDGMIAGYLALVVRDSGALRPAAQLARQALALTPLSSAAMNTIAMHADGRAAQGRSSLLALGSAGGWRDAGFQAYLAQMAFERRDLVQAATHVDTAARTTGISPTVEKLLLRLASSAEGRTALAHRLAQRPTWRRLYVEQLLERKSEIQDRLDVLRALASTSARATPGEKAVVLVSAAKSLGYAEAFAMWKALDRPDLSAGVYDPTFRGIGSEDSPKGLFGWQLMRVVVGGDAGPAMIDGKPALRVSADGSSAGGLVSQFVSLSPGIHHLSAYGKFATANDASGFRVTIMCWSNRGPDHFLSPTSGSATGAVRMTVDVPASDDCVLQSITIAAQQANLPQAVEGWFQRIQLD
jgi:hypothetical protein